MRQIKALHSFSSVVISFCCQRRWCQDRFGHKLITANIQCPKPLHLGISLNGFGRVLHQPSLLHRPVFWPGPEAPAYPFCFNRRRTGDSIWGKEVFLRQRLGGRKVFRFISETDFLAKVEWNWFLLRQFWERETHFRKIFQSKSCNLSLPWSCLSLLKGISGWGLWGW